MTGELSLLAKLDLFKQKMEGVEIIKSKEGYGYSYADLDSIITIVGPILREVGIGYYHSTDFDKESQNNIVITVLYNTENENQLLISRTLIDRSVTLAKMNQFMVEGSAITYFRRYHLSAMLGLLTDEDSDAGGKRKQSSTQQPTSRKPGRSVESVASTEPEEKDYVPIFKNLVKTKTKDKVEKTFEMYKKQISNEQIKEIVNIIKEAYENQ